MTTTTTFVNLGSTLLKIGEGFFVDAAMLSTRPFQLLRLAYTDTPLLTTLAKGGVGYGVVGTVSVALVSVSLYALVNRQVCESILKIAAAAFAADGLLQIPTLLFPPGLGYAPTFPYPIGRIGVFAFWELWCGVCFAGDCGSTRTVGMQNLLSRYALGSMAVSLRFMSSELPAETDATSAWVLSSLGAVCMSFAVTPRSFWDFMAKGFEKTIGVSVAVCTAAWNVCRKVNCTL
jgi:hypothetical protein